MSCPDKPFNGTWFFENKSGGTHPVFEAPVRLSASLKDVQVSYLAGKCRILVPGAELTGLSGDGEWIKKAAKSCSGIQRR